jgi:hypothetical protein
MLTMTPERYQEIRRRVMEARAATDAINESARRAMEDYVPKFGFRPMLTESEVATLLTETETFETVDALFERLDKETE